MCYRIAVTAPSTKIQLRFDAFFEKPETYRKMYHASAFSYPELPGISNDTIEKLRNLSWGLIPSWTKSDEAAMKIRNQTFNARAETLWEKPSFRHVVGTQRCLIVADGFYEFHHRGGKKFPYFIRLKNGGLFAFAGLWDEWVSSTGKTWRTCSIITTEANPLMAQIHNTKHRMPVILQQADEKRWLSPDIERDEIQALLQPYPEEDMDAYTVSRMITQRGRDTNVVAAREKVSYPELQVKTLDEFF